MRTQRILGWVLALGLAIGCAQSARARDAATAKAEDRGDGIPLSMFDTFIEAGELIVYPFFEGYVDSDAEYSPVELGYGLDEDFQGRYTATEELIFVGYGIREWLAVEIEAALIQASQETSPDDPSGIPSKIEESGLGDVEGQLRWRYAREASGRPEFFGYFETVVPTQDDGSLIGTTDWEFKLGSGAIRSFGFGTLALRAAVDYSRAEDKYELGEMAAEFMRRLGERVHGYLGVEGAEDEWELIGDLQWRLREGITLRLNSSIGLTEKATDWAPELGLIFRFP